MNKIGFVVSIFLYVFVYNSVNASCLNGAIPSITNSSICYWFFNSYLTFNESEIYCKTLGGHLASVNDGFTNTQIARHAKKAFPNAKDFWIGGEDVGKKDYWYWVDGANFTFTNWAPEEPVELPGFDCMGITIAKGFWCTYDCFKLKPYVCELPSSSSPLPTLAPITTTFKTTPLNVNTTLFLETTSTLPSTFLPTQQPTTSSSTNCPNGSVEWNSTCYIFQTIATSFGDAIVKCKNIKGNLISIHDALTNTIIASEAENYFTDSAMSDFWIGATTLMHAGTWSWIDNSVFDFSDWGSNEPQNSNGLDCAAMAMAGGA